MSDHDPLDSFAREARRNVVAPDFNDLVITSKRRRGAVTALSGVAVAAVVGVVAIGLQTASDGEGKAPGPSNTPSPTSNGTPSTPGQLADGIVDGSSAFLESAAILPNQPDARATVWHDPSNRTALAVTSDGFKTRSTLLLHNGMFPRVSAAGPDWFFVGQPRDNMLVSPEGESRAVHVDATPRPVGTDEILVQAYSGETLAVALVTGVAHPITFPQHAHAVYGGPDLIWTIAYTSSSQDVFHSAVEWSTD